MLDEVVLHTATRRMLETYLSDPTQGLLLVGPKGAGKTHTALQLAAAVLGLPSPEKLQDYPYFKHVQPVKGSIGIEQIRALKEFTSLKTPGSAKYRRAILIEDAQGMSTEAQNAYLKLLEEPPEDTILLMTVPQKTLLLPTILSRSQGVTVLAPPRGLLEAHFGAAGFSSVEVQKAYFISGGQVGLMHALLANDQTHPLLQSIDEAKRLITIPAFERLTQVDALSKNKEHLPDLLLSLQKVCRAGMLQAIANNRTAVADKFRGQVARLQDATDALGKNAQPKLLLTDLFLNL